MYLEGVKDGRRLLNLVRQISRTKPVLILKGGLTDSGARAVASHTGSMAGGQKIWNAFFKQSGALRMDSLDQLADAAFAFLNLGASEGRRVAVVGTGGGVESQRRTAAPVMAWNCRHFRKKYGRRFVKFTPPAGR